MHNCDSYMFKLVLQSNTVLCIHILYVCFWSFISVVLSLYFDHTDGYAANRFLISVSKTFHTQMILNWHLFCKLSEKIRS